MADVKVETIRARFRFAAANEAEQRTREVEDLQFDAGQQWPKEIQDARAGSPSMGNMPGTPPRPCLVIDKLKQPIRQVENQARNAKMAVEVSPKSDGASEELADVYQGVIRQIEYESRAQIARMDAFTRAIKCGRGFYRVLTGYANDTDDDLDILIQRILNQGSVYLDPTAEEPDWSDGKWAIIVSSLTAEQYKAEYGDSDLAKRLGDGADFRSIGDASDGWVQGDSEKTCKIRVAEYFYVDTEYEARDGSERKYERRRVKWCKTNGMDIIEEGDWPGRYIPIIPVIGEELFVPDETDPRRFQGIIRPARDSQTAFNYMVSAQVEAIGLAPKAPWLMAEGQQEGYEEWYQVAATRSLPYLLYKQTDVNGQPVAPPQRDQAEPPIQAISAATREFDAAIKATTGIFDPSLGNLSASERSGKAILALQRQADIGTSNFLDNFARSIAYEGRILVDLIPHVYGNRPGRVLRMITGNDDTKSIMVGVPFVPGEQGRPQQVPEGTPEAKFYDLQAPAAFSVIVKVGKGVDSAREETREILTETISAAPQLLSGFIDLYFKLLGQPQLADRAKLMLPPPIQQAIAAESGEISPQMMQAQLAQAMQTVQMLSQELNAKNQVIETDQIKAAQQTQIAQIKAANDERVAAMNNETKLAIEEIKAGMAQYSAIMAEALAMIRESHGHRHDAELRRAEHDLAREDRMVEVAESEATRQHDREMADLDRATKFDLERVKGEEGRMTLREKPSPAE